MGGAEFDCQNFRSQSFQAGTSCLEYASKINLRVKRGSLEKDLHNGARMSAKRGRDEVREEWGTKARHVQGICQFVVWCPLAEYFMGPEGKLLHQSASLQRSSCSFRSVWNLDLHGLQGREEEGKDALAVLAKKCMSLSWYSVYLSK